MSKKEISLTFRLDEKMHEWLNKQVHEIEDCSRSELIRTCILLSIHTVKACPSLLRIITLDDIKSQHD